MMKFYAWITHNAWANIGETVTWYSGILKNEHNEKVSAVSFKTSRKWCCLIIISF